MEVEEREREPEWKLAKMEDKEESGTVPDREVDE